MCVTAIAINVIIVGLMAISQYSSSFINLHCKHSYESDQLLISITVKTIVVFVITNHVHLNQFYFFLCQNMKCIFI